MRIRAFSRSAWALLGRLVRERRLGLVARKAWSLARTGDWRDLRDKARRTLGRATPPAPDAYDAWMARRVLGAADVRRIRGEIAAMARPPRFSVLMPVYDTDEVWLRRAIESVIAQLYPHWELCIADDASPRPHVRAVLEEYAARDSRIRVFFRPARGHISAATNSALAMATGDFVALLDHDDEIAPEALHENARLLERHPDADMIYSDEDKLSPAGVRLHPHFKPDWSPELFASVMYTCHLGVYRTSLVRAVGGMREGFEGSQDYDLVLRLAERTDRIHHIPSVLYHWRVIAGSTAAGARQKEYTEQASARALTEHFARGGGAVDVGGGPLPNTYRVRHRLAATPLVSILIPTRDAADLLRRCVASILAKSTYPQYEIVVIDNQSGEAARRDLAALEGEGSARLVRFDRPFNYAALNNEAARHARGELLLFLNNDTEVIEAEWMEAMVEHAVRPPVGAVGARLLYPDGRIQHGGVILGLGGVADHAHKHLPRHEVGYYGRAKMIQNFSAVTAACLMMRRSVFEEVGGFDEVYEVAFNDVDLCLRLRARGYRVVWTPYAELYHHESATRGHEDTPDKRRRLAAEVEHLRRRWGAALDRDPYYSPHLTLDRYDFSLREPA